MDSRRPPGQVAHEHLRPPDHRGVDRPPLSVALAGLARILFGNSLLGLRLFPALADGGVAFTSGVIARELGGGRFAQRLSALAVAIGPFLIAGHLAGPTIYDFLAWAFVSWLVLRILRTGRDHLWVAVGLVVGASPAARVPARAATLSQAQEWSG